MAKSTPMKSNILVMGVDFANYDRQRRSFTPTTTPMGVDFANYDPYWAQFKATTTTPGVVNYAHDQIPAIRDLIMGVVGPFLEKSTTMFGS